MTYSFRPWPRFDPTPMNDDAHRAHATPPFGGVVLWQAADSLLAELFGATFDFWAYCEQWQPVLERSDAFSAAPVHARLRQGEALCVRVAGTGRAQCCEWDDGRMLVGVTIAEHGQLHLVAIAQLPEASPVAIGAIFARFAQRWAERESAERDRDAQWLRACAAQRG
jgi:hypothetical protein